MEADKSPFKEVKIASDYLRHIASLLGFELKGFRFEEFEYTDDKNTLKISFSYESGDNYYGLKSEMIRKTVTVKNGEVLAVFNGSLADNH